MDAQIIGIRELHQNLKRISNAAMRGKIFTVVRNSKPVFRIEPIVQSNRGKYTLADLAKIRFKGDKNLSRNIDRILYGRK